MELCWSSVAFGIRISSRLQSDRSQRLQGLGRRSSEAAVRLALTMTFSSPNRILPSSSATYEAWMRGSKRWGG